MAPVTCILSYCGLWGPQDGVQMASHPQTITVLGLPHRYQHSIPCRCSRPSCLFTKFNILLWALPNSSPIPLMSVQSFLFFRSPTQIPPLFHPLNLPMRCFFLLIPSHFSSPTTSCSPTPLCLFSFLNCLYVEVRRTVPCWSLCFAQGRCWINIYLDKCI